MTKIMLVEDDKSLREIYGARLLAEGYDIVSAGDGEEALAIAIKERPALIISDVMMPKISGFDMLDILRSSTETRNTKVIMMTALSSDDQRARGEQLGADRYLVKSQVGIEDVVRVVHEVLEDSEDTAPQEAVLPQAQGRPTPIPGQAPPTQLPEPMPVVTQQPMATPAPNTSPDVTVPTPAPLPPAPQQQAQPIEAQAQPAAPTATDPEPQPVAPVPAPAPPMPTGASSAPKPASNYNRTIQPLNDLTKDTVNINELLDKELAKEAGVDPDNRPVVATTEQERNLVDSQIDQFANTPPPATIPTEQSDQPPVVPPQPSEQPPAQPVPFSDPEQLPPPPLPPMPTEPPVSPSPPDQQQPPTQPPRPPVAL